MMDKRVQQRLDRIQQDMDRINSDIQWLREYLSSMETDESLNMGFSKEREKSKRFELVGAKPELAGYTKNKFSQRSLFKVAIANLAPKYTFRELKEIFNKSKYGESYDLIIERIELESLSQGLRDRYLLVPTKTKDKKEIMTWGNWGEFRNKDTKTPGNFPILREELKELGFQVKDAE